MSLFNGFGDFRWHIIFVVLGQYFIGNKHAIGLQLTLSHNTLTFTEQIRQDTFVIDGYVMGVIGHHKTDFKAIGSTLDGAFTHHTTSTDTLFMGCLASGNIRRLEEQIDVL